MGMSRQTDRQTDRLTDKASIKSAELQSVSLQKGFTYSKYLLSNDHIYNVNKIPSEAIGADCNLVTL